MSISDHDITTLEKIGVEIEADTVKVEDSANKIVHEFSLKEVAQLFLKRPISLKNFIPKRKAYKLVVCTWDLRKITLNIPQKKLEEVKDALKRINQYFYTAS